MNKGYLKRSIDLRKDARDLLFEKGVHDLFSKHGRVVYAGSYAMDLMTWKDIDLNIIVKASDSCCEKALVNDLLDRDDVSRLKVLRDLYKKYGDAMPNAAYVGGVIDGWKFDIFLVDQDQANKTKEKTEGVISLLTDEKREKILYWKDKLLTSSGRSPKFSSVHVYDAILKHNLAEDQEVYSYLRNKGIDV